MSQPESVVHIQLTLANGQILSFDSDKIFPGANYSVSRNFNRPPRKKNKDEPKEIPETWLSHNVHFLTEREPEVDWLQRHVND